MIRPIHLALPLSIICACGVPAGPANSNDKPLVNVIIDLGEKTATILAPEDARVRSAPGSSTAILEIRPGFRNSQPITLTLSDRGSPHHEKIQLSSGASLSYEILRPEPPHGMGGPEAFLVGHLYLNGAVVEVRCWDQKDWGEPDPSWCIPYLHHLELLDSLETLSPIS